MDFSNDSTMERFGKVAGFIFSFILFNLVLNLVLAWSGSFSALTRPIYVLGITLIIMALGLSLRRMLE